MNLSLQEEAREIMMPDWMPRSCRVWLHDINPARDGASRASARVLRHVNRYPAAAGAFGLADDGQYLPSMPGNGGRVAATRRAAFLAALRDRAFARDLW
jgi:hypothetical protein